ncbi:hypothetical protein [Kordiimonas aquimaris]|uniref:hypothetical protein n=1 Tax=Kordiimonas aquimaris TaxID=707591 RepID=UPI0021CEC2DE|nr:hypothetical protein [Kordiimonas aquimaris]
MAKIDSDELEDKVGEINRISKEQEQDALFVSMRDDGETHGRMETSASAAAKAANPENDKNGKKKRKELSTAELLIMLQDQARYWGEQADRYEAQSNATGKAIENVENGKAPTDGMSDDEKAHFEDAVQAYKEKYNLTDVDLNDPDVLHQIKALADENQTHAKINEVKANELIDKAQHAKAPDAILEVAKEHAAAGLDISDKATTETHHSVEQIKAIDQERGLNQSQQNEVLEAFDTNDDYFSDSSTFDDLDMPDNTQPISVASTIDDKPLFGKEPISGEFQAAALGQPAAQPVDLELDITLAQKSNPVTPSGPGQSFS